jgi:hypothetical protein
LPPKRIDLVRLLGGLHQWDFHGRFLYSVYLTDVTHGIQSIKRSPRKARLARKKWDKEQKQGRKKQSASSIMPVSSHLPVMQVVKRHVADAWHESLTGK